MESGRFLTAGVKKLRFQRIKNGMAHFMADDVWACPRKHHPVGGRAMKEVERLPIVKGVEVFALVEQDRQHGSEFPFARRHSRRPKVGATPQRGRGRPVTEPGGVVIVARRRSWLREPESQGRRARIRTT